MNRCICVISVSRIQVIYTDLPHPSIMMTPYGKTIGVKDHYELTNHRLELGKTNIYIWLTTETTTIEHYQILEFQWCKVVEKTQYITLACTIPWRKPDPTRKKTTILHRPPPTPSFYRILDVLNSQTKISNHNLEEMKWLTKQK